MKLTAFAFSLICFFAANSWSSDYLPILSAKSAEGNLYNEESLKSVMEELLKAKPQATIKIEYSYDQQKMKECVEREVSLYIKHIKDFGVAKGKIAVELKKEKDNKITILAK